MNAWIMLWLAQDPDMGSGAHGWLHIGHISVTPKTFEAFYFINPEDTFIGI